MSQLSKTVRRIGQATAWIEDLLLVLLLLVMILLATSQIALRELFDSGLVWADPTLRVLVLWVGLFGALVATRDDNHIHIDILSRYLSPRIRCYTQLVTSLFTVVVSATVAWYAAGFVLLEWQDGVMLTSFLPAWVAELVIPFGFGMIALSYISRSVDRVIRLIRGAAC